MVKTTSNLSEFQSSVSSVKVYCNASIIFQKTEGKAVICAPLLYRVRGKQWHDFLELHLPFGYGLDGLDFQPQ